MDHALAHAATALIGVILFFELAWCVAQLQPVRAAAGKAPGSHLVSRLPRLAEGHRCIQPGAQGIPG